MSNASNIFRSLIIYGLCLPLAVFLGYMLATPLDLTTFLIIAGILMILMVPLLLRWHHPWLIATWNMSAVIFFVPGRPQLWMAMAGISLLAGILQFALNRKLRFLSAPSVARPLVFLALVTVITAELTGGMGFKAFGSEIQGGKRYFSIFAAILGYFALTSRQIPPQRAVLYVSLFFLSQATLAIGNLAGIINPSFNFMFLIFPVENVEALTTSAVGPLSFMTRSWGLSVLGMGVFCFLLVRHGLRGVFDLKNPLRVAMFLLFMFVGLLGGFRSVLITYLLTLGMLFYFEGLMSTRMLPALLLGLILGGTLIAGFANRLPLSVQRTLAFLPVDVDPIAKLDAQGSTEWRLKLWQDVLPDVPKHLLLGKGFAFSGTDAQILQATARGEEGRQGTVMVGDYHNGPLSVILPLGIPGVLAFLWFLIASGRALYYNFHHGPPEYRRMNTFLLAYFLAKVVFFFTVFGSLYSDLATFAGVVGLSISLNGGIARPAPAPQPQFAFDPGRLHPGLRRPVGV